MCLFFFFFCLRHAAWMNLRIQPQCCAEEFVRGMIVKQKDHHDGKRDDQISQSSRLSKQRPIILFLSSSYAIWNIARYLRKKRHTESIGHMMRQFDHAKKNDDEYFSYLEDLRDSGITNMFGAAPYLQDSFGLTKDEARKVLVRWMESY